MKLLVFSALGLLILAVEGVLIEALGLGPTHLSAGLALLVYLAVRGTTLEGALTAYALGYLLDVLSGKPTGLYPFLSMVIFIGARIAAQILDGRSRVGLVLFTSVAATAQWLLALLLTSLTSVGGAASGFSLGSLPLQVVYAAVAAFLLYPLCRRLEPGERPDPRAIKL